MRYTFDSREVKPGMGFVALKGEKVDGHAFIPQARAAGAVDIIDGLEELQRRALEYRRTLKAKVIGVTGSAGKTTTKELLRAFLSTTGKTSATEGNFNNHIGLPMTILNCPEDAEFLVVEMGTNHPGEIETLCRIAEPNAGLITNVGTAHLEFFKTQDGIATEKGVLGAWSKEFFVIGSDNVRLEALKAMCRGEAVVADTAQEWMRDSLADVLPGAHNVANACIAYECAKRFGVTRGMAVGALRDFALPGARWRKIEKWGATFIDDTYNANPDSMIAALDAFVAMPCSGKRIAVLGDMFELGPEALDLHRKVFAHAMGLGIPLVIGVGELSSRCPCHLTCKDLAVLKKKFGVDVSAGDSVLLKASHSMKLGELIT